MTDRCKGHMRKSYNENIYIISGLSRRKVASSGDLCGELAHRTDAKTRRKSLVVVSRIGMYLSNRPGPNRNNPPFTIGMWLHPVKHNMATEIVNPHKLIVLFLRHIPVLRLTIPEQTRRARLVLPPRLPPVELPLAHKLAEVPY